MTRNTVDPLLYSHPTPLARNHGAPWAAQLTQDEMDNAMTSLDQRYRASEGAWAHPPRKTRPVGYTATRAVLWFGLVACVSGLLALVVVSVKAVL